MSSPEKCWQEKWLMENGGWIMGLTAMRILNGQNGKRVFYTYIIEQMFVVFQVTFDMSLEEIATAD